MKTFKRVFSIVLSTILFCLFILGVIAIAKGSIIDTKSQEQKLLDYSKTFNIEKLNIIDESGEITQTITNNKEGYTVTFKYENTTLEQKYDVKKQLIEKNYYNDKAEYIAFSILFFIIFVLLFVISFMYTLQQLF